MDVKYLNHPTKFYHIHYHLRDVKKIGDYAFNNNYQFIKETSNLRSIAAHPENGYFEKSHVAWFTLDDLKRKRNEFRDYFRNFLDIIKYRAHEIRSIILKKRKKTQKHKHKHKHTRTKKR